MTRLGLFDMLQYAAGLSMAGPMFLVGIDFLRSGQPVLGAGLFALGAVTLYFPTYLLNRIGGPRTWIRRRLGTAGSESDDARAETERSSPLDRFRR